MQEVQKHKYEYAVDTTADTAPARVVRMIGKNQRVLEIGSGPGSITKQLKGTGDCRITALEIDPVAIELVKPFCEAVHSADLNAADWDAVLDGQKFEVVLAADVLEHVYNPLAVLKKMASLVSDGGRVVLSLPHVGHSAIAACLLLEDFDYRDWGLLDKTHIRFFGLKNIQALVQDAGLVITRAEFVVRHPDETEFADKWAKLSSSVQKALLTNRHGFVYQVVLEAQTITPTSMPLSLFDQAVTHPRLNGSGQGLLSAIGLSEPAVKARLGTYLSPEMKSRIKRLASGLGFRL
jgi:2-polyprenyl-3-methyl-5-hydroxy-6-metoxy-1,4-benzoquinol methylase